MHFEIFFFNSGFTEIILNAAYTVDHILYTTYKTVSVILIPWSLLEQQIYNILPLIRTKFAVHRKNG